MRPVSPVMHLTKHHGLGNDFLVLVDLDGRTPVDGATARWLCDRRRGVGADGFICVSPAPVPIPTDAEGVTAFQSTVSGGEVLGGPGYRPEHRPEKADGVVHVSMTLHNADGTLAEMSGNGIRCLGQAVARHRGVTSLDLSVATAGGLRRLRVEPGPADYPDTAWVEVDMGPAQPGPQSAALPALVDVTKTATVDMGNPHLVLLVDDPGVVDLSDLGPACQAAFPEGINVEVVALAPGNVDSLDLVVWERGVGLTQACGTGACAAAHIAHDWGLVGERVRVRMPGGVVDVALGATVTLAGPATFVAEIEVVAHTEVPR